LLGVTSTLLTTAAAAPIAAFFHEPALTKVVPVMALGFLVGAIRVVPSAVLVREMRFRAIARVETAEGLGMLVFTLGLALTGYGYWSLVVGTLLGRAVGATVALIASPLRMTVPPDIRGIAGSVRFGAWVAFSTLAWYVYTSADRLIVGRLVGEAALGAYTIAMTLAALPVEKISPLYLRVTEALIAEVQSDSRAVARYLLRITEGVAFLTFPLSIGLALVADQFVPVVLGEQWREAIIPMQVLAIASALRSLDPLLAQVLVATGHARDNAASMAIAAVMLPVGFLVAVHWGMGLAGIAAVWLIGHPLIVLARQIWLALRVAEASVSEYIRALSPAVVSTAIMAAAVLGLRAILDDSIPASVSLVLTTAIGLAAYAVSVLGLFPDRLRRAWKATKNTR